MNSRFIYVRNSESGIGEFFVIDVDKLFYIVIHADSLPDDLPTEGSWSDVYASLDAAGISHHKYIGMEMQMAASMAKAIWDYRHETK